MKKLFQTLALMMVMTTAQAGTSAIKMYDYYDYTKFQVVNSIATLTTTQWMEYSGVFHELPTPVSINKSAIRVRMKVSDWSQLEEFTLIFSSSGSNFADTYEIDLSWHIKSATNNEWIDVVVPFSELYQYGSPNAKSINTFMWRISDKGGARISASISNLEIIPTNGTPKVSITVDDGNATTLDAANLMTSFGFRGSAFIDETVLNADPYLTSTELLSVKSQSWGIGGHEVRYNYKALSNTRLNTVIRNTYNFLIRNGFTGYKVFAYPNGIHNARVASYVGKYYSAMLNIDGMSNAQPVVNVKNINRFSIDMWTPVGLATKWVDNAITNNEWIILNFHTFYPTMVADEDYTLENFEQILSYLQQTGVQVLPVHEVLATMPAPVATANRTIWKMTR